MTRQSTQQHQPRSALPSVVVFALGLVALLSLGGCSFNVSFSYGNPQTNFRTGTTGPADVNAIQAVTVTDAAGLLAAIKSNRTIFLEPGEYVLSDVTKPISNIHARKSGSFDGAEYSVHNVRRLRLVGMGEPGDVRIMVSPQYSDVLTFIDVEDVRLRNITFGHGPEQGNCEGGVLKFERARDIHLSDLDLFGCGTYGLWLEKTQRLTAENITIRDCTYGIMQLHQSTDINFKNSTFRDNRGWDMVETNECTDVTFDACRFVDNAASIDSLDAAFFKLSRSHNIAVTNSEIVGNQATHLATPAGQIILRQVKQRDNDWVDMRRRPQK